MKLYSKEKLGLCCNAIHFIDLFFFLSYEKITDVKHYDFLKDKIYKSKRNGFYELKGKINFECNNSNKLTLVDSFQLKKIY